VLTLKSVCNYGLGIKNNLQCGGYFFIYTLFLEVLKLCLLRVNERDDFDLKLKNPKLYEDNERYEDDPVNSLARNAEACELLLIISHAE
jgi:hypothetical protein